MQAIARRMTSAAEPSRGASIAARWLNARRRAGRRRFARPHFAEAQGRRPGMVDNDDREGSATGKSAMNGFILFAYPTIAALGALASLSLFVLALSATKTNRSRVRVPARRPRSR
jgi:hypothetical protein